MDAVEPIELPETTLIIGDNFPTQDETAYAREAHNQRRSAQHAADAGGAALAAARYTDPEFRGLAGGALATKLSAHHRIFAADQVRHANVASWLDLGAENITRTKTAMNQIAADYHDTYDTLCRRAQDETWPQHRLRTVKDEAVAAAQSRVHDAREVFDMRHRTVRKGVISGGAPDQETRSSGEGPTVRAVDNDFGKQPGAGSNGEPSHFDAVESAATRAQRFSDKDLYPHDPTAADIEQDSIGDCYLDATMGAIANANPQWIKDRIKYDPDSGHFDVTLWNGHEWQHIPVAQADIQTDIDHHGASLRDNGQPNAALWPSVVESAYAKFRNPEMSIGQALDSGIVRGESATAMEALTGNQGTNIDPAKVWLTNEHIDQHISQALTNHQPVTISTTPHSGSLIPSHTYIVEGIDGTGSDAQLTLRNPWGNNPNDPHNPLVTVRLGDAIGSGPTGGFDRFGTHPTYNVNIGSLG